MFRKHFLQKLTGTRGKRFLLYNDFILNTGLSLCIRRLSCVSIYKSANDKIVQTGIKAELEGKKDFECLSFRHGM